MIRVLQVLHSMNRGGAEAMLMNYYRNIDRTKVQFDFLLTEQNHCQYEDEITEMGGKVYRVPLLKLSNPFPYIIGVRNFLKQHKEYKIVHSHTSSKSAIPLWVAKTCGVPVRVCHAHNNSSGTWSVNRCIRDILKFPLKKVATHRFACSNEAAVWLYGSMADCSIMANAIDLSVFSANDKTRNQIRESIGVPTDTVVIGMISRFSHQKNHSFALDIFAEYHSSNRNSKLLLVGDGELRSSIESKVKTLGISDSVIMTGVVPNVSEYASAMDVLLMPSYNEGLPVSLVEAQAVGLKCLVSTGVPSEVNITGLVDFLPLSKGAEAWAETLTCMLETPRLTEQEIQNSLREAGYDIKLAAKKLETWYCTCLENH